MVCVVAFCINDEFRKGFRRIFYYHGIGILGDDVVYKIFCFLFSEFVRR